MPPSESMPVRSDNDSSAHSASDSDRNADRESQHAVASAAAGQLYLIADAVACAKMGQKTPNGYYNIERMLKPLVRKGKVMLCGTCMDARGPGEEDILEGCTRSTLDELTNQTLEADKVLVF